MKNYTSPDVGVRFTSGGIFGALTALESFSKFSVYGMYKLQDNVKLAATYTMPTDAKKKASFGVGGVYDVQPGIKVKGKVDKDDKSDALSANLAIKYEISKGFTTTFGGKLTFEE